MLRRVKKWVQKIRTTASEPISVTLNIEGKEQTQTLIIEDSTSLLNHARRNGIDISSYCGGMCSCGTCIVDIVSGLEFTSPQSSRETAVLGYSKKESSRLACQLTFVGSGCVHIRLREQF